MSRITIVGPAYPMRGGIAHHVYWLRQALAARGHEAQVISFRKLYPSLLFPGATEMDTSGRKLDAGATPLLTSLNPLTWKRAQREIRAFRPACVVFQWWQPFFAPLAGTLARWLRKSGAVCVFECHNVHPHEQTPLDNYLLRYAFRPADHFITHSQRDREELLALMPGSRVSVSPLPALAEFAGPNRGRRDGRTILFFGKVRKYKGLDVLLAALPKVLAQVDCRLLVVGEFYDSIDRYRRLIRDYGIEDNVRVEDRYVANEEVASLFERADVLALPYVSASQSGVAKIAVTNALPMIAADVGGLSEVVRDNETGLLFPPGDADALADCLISFFAKNLGPVFAENMRALATEGRDCRIVEIIEECLEKPARAQPAVR
ncbi:MAG TPA: glycosyltransferase family 4 protein [Blastocatellia bacterium]|nr:glycosyltransferase family 4 protein [Blastocatellia bacterium]